MFLPAAVLQWTSVVMVILTQKVTLTCHQALLLSKNSLLFYFEDVLETVK